MEVFIAIGVAALIEALNNVGVVQKNASKFAKVFVAIERFAETSPMLRAAIEKARQRP